MTTVQDCLRRVMDAANLDQAQAQEVLDQAKEARDAILGAEREISRAEGSMRRWAEHTARTDIEGSLALRRRKAINIVRRNEFYLKARDLVGQGMEPDRAVMSLLMGSQEDARGARASISRRRGALEKEFLGPVAHLFRQLPEVVRLVSLPGRGKELGRLTRDVVAEMLENRPGGQSGQTTNAVAKRIADVFTTTMEELRTRMNRAGADIAQVQGYVPQRHDSRRIRLAGKERWVADVMQWLDLERTFPNIAQESVGGALGEVHRTLTLGKHWDPTMAEKGIPATGSDIARRFGESRVLHFKDADAWQAYHDRYGTGNVIEAVLQKIHRAVRSLSVMETLGASPRTGLQGVADRFKRDIAAGIVQVADAGKAMDRLDAGRIQSGQGRLGRALSEVMGETLLPENITAARIAGGTRAVISMAKLGGAVLSAVADLPVIVRNLNFHGQGLLESWRNVLGRAVSAFKGREREEFTYLFDAFTDGVLGDLHSRWTLEEPGALHTAMTTFFKLSGLTGWTDFWKSGVVRMYSAWLGRHAGMEFAQLPEGLRQVFKLHNITPAKWETLRKVAHAAEDGKAYLLPELVDKLSREELARLIPEYESFPGAAGTWGERAPDSHARQMLGERRERMVDRVRDELRSDLLGFYADEAAFAVLEADDRVRFTLLQGTRPGTMPGEVLRFAAQFKGFPMAQIQRTWGRALFASGKGRAAKAVDLASLMATMTAFGYVSMTLKDLSKGKGPRDITDPDKAAGVLSAAFVQGGGAGIFGDYLFSRYNRFGGGLAETLAGPVLSGPVADAASIWADVVEGNPKGAKVLRTMVNNAPYANLWWARAALNYLFVYELEELMTPGIHRRREQQIRKEYGQEYFVPPSRWVKE